jgi:two-component system cell cycle sensor histidine kinase/response regulator CckA
MKVLLVAGDLEYLSLITEMLDQAQPALVLSQVTMLAGALERLDDESFDVVVADLDLPDSERRDVARELLAAPGDPAVVVIVGLGDHATAGEALAAGVQDYVVKGCFDAALLEHSLRRSIERNRLAARAPRTRGGGEGRFAAFMDTSPALVSVKHPDGTYAWVNQSWDHEFGFKPGAWLGRRAQDLLADDIASSLCEHDAAVLETGEPALSQREAVTAAGQRRWESFKFRFLDADGDPLLGTITIDVTARTMAAEDVALRAEVSERERALESLAQLAGGIAHDFNNLLGVVLTYVTLLERRCEDVTVLADLGEIRTAGQRGAVLTKQLLSFAGRDAAGPRELDVTAVVRELAPMLERTLGHHIELRLELSPGPVLTRIGVHALEQILLNLALNARDAMPDGGVLTIAARALAPGPGHASDAVLTVRDTGTGMSPEEAARAFEPFYTTKPRGRGTGLGLATVYGIVRQNLGDISIASTVGAGTTLTISLPGTADGRTAVEPTDRIAGGDERLLVVEDEAALRSATARLLAENGYEVLVAGDGQEGLEVFDREDGRFDAVLTDIVMPRMRGDELARLLAERNRELPVIFLSAHDWHFAFPNGRRLEKPVVERDLLRAIREVIDGAASHHPR